MEVVLIELLPQLVFPIGESSHVAAARRGASEMARALSFDETHIGRVAIIVTEAATNILKHASHGSLLVRDVSQNGPVGINARIDAGIEIIALDSGPGIANLNASLCDGVSTAGSPGTGLGAMQRLSEHFDAYTVPGRGSVFCMTVRASANGAPATAALLGAVCLPIASEEVCGDSWHAEMSGRALSVMVADGLGHGPDARVASQAALLALKGRGAMSPTRLLELAHEAARPTRGAAVAAARIDFDQGLVSFAGVGNISASIHGPDARRQMMSHNGIVGHNVRKIQEFSFPWTPDSILILHSDGLGTHWDLQSYLGLEHRHPALIAAILYRDHARPRDDACIVVIKNDLSTLGQP